MQHQRKLERTIRKQKQDIALLERAGADEEDIIAAKCRLRLTNQNYVDFSKAMGIRQQLERLRTVNEQSDVSAKQSRVPVETEQRTTNYRDSTDEWKEVSPEQAKSVIDLKEYEIGGQKYVVDGHNVVLDYKPYEREIAEVVAKKYGKSVQMVPRVDIPQGIRTPDYVIDGVEYDLKHITKPGNNTIYNRIKEAKGQSNNFIIDLTGNELMDNEVLRQIESVYRSNHTRFVQNLITIKNGEIKKVFSRNKK